MDDAQGKADATNSFVAECYQLGAAMENMDALINEGKYENCGSLVFLATSE